MTTSSPPSSSSLVLLPRLLRPLLRIVCRYHLTPRMISCQCPPANGTARNWSIAAPPRLSSLNPWSRRSSWCSSTAITSTTLSTPACAHSSAHSTVMPTVLATHDQPPMACTSRNLATCPMVTCSMTGATFASRRPAGLRCQFARALWLARLPIPLRRIRWVDPVSLPSDHDAARAVRTDGLWESGPSADGAHAAGRAPPLLAYRLPEPSSLKPSL